VADRWCGLGLHPPVAVASNPKLLEEGRPNMTFTITTCDAFFERLENCVRSQGSQLAPIDGNHSFSLALRDFENLAALAAPDSIIAIHDCPPWMLIENAECRDSVPRRRCEFSGYLRHHKVPKSSVCSFQTNATRLPEQRLPDRFYAATSEKEREWEIASATNL